MSDWVDPDTPFTIVGILVAAGGSGLRRGQYPRVDGGYRDQREECVQAARCWVGAVLVRSGYQLSGAVAKIH